MKATTWLCPVLTLLCATNVVYTAQRGSYGGYPLDDMDSQLLQNDYFRSKRNKPSLSIVNPLDVLRQRLLLEIARRQMKENSRQVELNRAILKNVGKRMASKYSSPLTAALYESQQRQMQQPYEYELIPTTLIFDYLQQGQQQQQMQQQQQQRHPWLPHELNAATQFDNNYINDFIDSSSGDDAENDVDNGELEFMALNRVFGDNNDKASLKHIKQQNSNEHLNAANEQQLQQQHERETATFQKSINNSNRNDERKRLTLINNHQQQQQQQHKNDLNLDLNDANPLLSSSNPNANDLKNEMNVNGSNDYQLQRYLYHLHKNQHHFTRK